MGDTDVPGVDACGPAQRRIRAPVPRARLVNGAVVIHRDADPRSPVRPGEGALAKARQEEQLQVAQGGDPGEVDHRLAQVILAVGIFHQIHLVDDIDQMGGFSDAPEYLGDPGAQFPVPLDTVPVEFADIAMAALAVALVPAQEGGDGEAVALAQGLVEFRLQGQGDIGARQAVEGRALVKVPVLGADIAADIDGQCRHYPETGQQGQQRRGARARHLANAAQGVDVEIPFGETHPEFVVAVG